MAELTLKDRQQEYVEEERAHNEQIPDKYRSLLDRAFTGGAMASAVPTMPAPVEAPAAPAHTAPAEHTENAPVYQPQADPARRIGDYVAHPAPEGTGLYQNATYSAEEGLKFGEMNDDDATPTPRTMDTIRRPAAYEQTRPIMGTIDTPIGATAAATSAPITLPVRKKFFACLSTRMKVGLCVIAAAIVIAVVIAIVNTTMLSRLNAGIASKQFELDRVVREAEKIEKRIEDAKDPDNVGEWAQENNMVRGN